MHVIGHIGLGSAWRPGVPVIEQGEPMARHLDYMKGLYDRGSLVLGGPYVADGDGGIAVFVTDSLEAAERLAADDPAAKADVITYRLTTLHAVFDRAADVDRSAPLAAVMAGSGPEPHAEVAT